MRLLVSVSSGAEAAEALAGGAGIIDAKDPRAGALGAVPLAVLGEIVERVGGIAPVTAALGDDLTAEEAQRAARRFAITGVSFLKIGFTSTNAVAVSSILEAAVRGAAPCGVIAVSYADRDNQPGGIGSDVVIEIAARAGARGVLLDTVDKAGPGLADLMSPAAIEGWVARAHERGLIAAVAGRLSADDLPMTHAAGADIAGVRGAACEGGRRGQVRADRVRTLVEMVESLRGVPVGSGATHEGPPEGGPHA